MHSNVLHGNVCLITGATDGIGKATARELARQGATVVGTGRNPEKTERVLAEIKRDSGSDDVNFLLADLAEMDQVRALAAEFRSRYDRLDVLVNNAGAMFPTRGETVDGFEQTFALNHLAYFLLTNLLLDMLIASAPARVISVSSDSHRRGKINFNDLQRKRSYSGWGAYGDSKLANVLFSNELARRLAGTGVTSNALHPGLVATNFFDNAGIPPMGGVTPEDGAETMLYLATSPEVEGVTGRYYVDSREREPVAAAQDMDVARRLWDVSAEMVGLGE
ncbi:MAG: SDR family oxidoreductase [Chloroflexi bacterium]|nr:SDR family oxidoreductase [Chloroflexota bacterium]